MPFLPLFRPVPSVSSTRLPHSSRFAAQRNLTFRVMGGKSGKIQQEVATDGKVSGNNGTDVKGCGHLHAAAPAAAIRCGGRVRRAMRLFKVPAARGGAAKIELIYHMM